jgi:putative membrane protein
LPSAIICCLGDSAMVSERRLHPASFFFAMGGHAKQLLLPGLVVLISARSGRGNWETWAMVFIVPFAITAAVRVLSYRYRFDEAELVVRTGFIFRNERHIPYARIQNVDAVQNLLHRGLGVADVRIETGGGSEGEARMRVVSLGAFRELRDRVFEGRSPLAGDPVAGGPGAPAEPSGARAVRAGVVAETILHLPFREVVLCGLIEGRGLVVLSGIFGVLWEAGLIDNIVGTIFGEPTSGRGAILQMVRAIVGQGALSPARISLTLVAFGTFLIVVRGFSAAWAVVTLHGFRLARAGKDLRLEYGLLTRVTATIPTHRIQALTIHEGPLHRLCGRVSIRVDTAGGDGQDPAQAQRQRLAPLLRRGDLDQFLRAVLPDHDSDVVWNPVDRRGFRRKLTRSAIVVAFAGAALAWPLRAWTVPVFVLMFGWAAIHARQWIRRLGWATTNSAVLFRSGWLWRNTTLAPLGKIQIVAIRESPFDRRLQMAAVVVDTAGAGESHRVHIPYLARDTAHGLAEGLAVHAARSTFRW